MPDVVHKPKVKVQHCLPCTFSFADDIFGLPGLHIALLSDEDRGTATSNMQVKFGNVVFEIRERTDRRTDMLIGAK